MRPTARSFAWRALVAFMVKEVRSLLRDRQTFLVLLLLPVAQLLLFGYAVRTDLHDVRVALAAPAPDATAAALRARFAHSGRFALLPPLTSSQQLETLFRRGDADVGVFLAPDFAAQLHRGEPAQVELVTDAVDPNTGITMQNYVNAEVRDWQASLGVPLSAVQVDTRVRMRFNPTLVSVNLFVPGLIALILTLVTSLMTALSLSREKERGTMEVLLVSPLRPWQIIVGNVLPYLVLALANAATVMLAARVIFAVPFRGSLWLLMAASTLFALVSLALGVCIAAVTRTQMAATLAALGGTMLPSTMLSGLIFPIASMPKPLQLVSAVVPARWFVTIVRGIMLQGVGVDVLWRPLAILAVMLAALLALAIGKTSARLT